MNVMEQTLEREIDPALTGENLSTLSSRALNREARVKSCRILTGGCWNRVISVAFEQNEPELVFKINPEAGNDGIQREFEVLKYFAENTAMPVPDPYLIDPSGDIIPGTVLVMSKIPGFVLHQAYSHLDGVSRRSVSEQIGHFVGRLHQRRSTGFGGVELGREQRTRVWADFWLPQFDTVFEDIAGRDLISDSFVDEIEQMRRGFPGMIDIGQQSTLTHYDIWSGNVMVDLDGDSVTVSGFIDIPGHWADYARELSFMEVFGSADPIFYGVYKNYSELDPGFELRKNIYQLRTYLKHITMYPDQQFYRGGARECVRFIRKAG